MICLKCGGSIRGKDFNLYCEHDFGPQPPEPTMSRVFLPAKNEKVWRASSLLPDGTLVRLLHPLREQAAEDQKKLWLMKLAEKPVPKPKPNGRSGQTWRKKADGQTVILRAYWPDSSGARWSTEGDQRPWLLDSRLGEDYELADNTRRNSKGEVVPRRSEALKKHATRGARLVVLAKPEAERTYYDWLALASSSEVSDRKAVTDVMRTALGMSVAEFMPMNAERRASLVWEYFQKTRA